MEYVGFEHYVLEASGLEACEAMKADVSSEAQHCPLPIGGGGGHLMKSAMEMKGWRRRTILRPSVTPKPRRR